MRTEKGGGTKAGGFFNLFDWNRKSRKKLFSNASPEGTKQEKGSTENSPATQLRLIDEDESVGVSSVKGSSDYSYASSVIDEEGNGVRAPGVVARLMGLESMPTSGVSEPCNTPFFDRRSPRDNPCCNESDVSDQFSYATHRGEGYPRKLIELRSQKMPSSPIERFQTEVLPPKSAKSISMAHHKLLSPIKNPGFTSSKNATHIMEAAAKILESGFQVGNKSRTSSLEAAMKPSKVHDPMERLAASQRTSRNLDSGRTSVATMDVRCLRGQSLNRSWDGSECGSVFRRSPESERDTLPSAKGERKSISLAIQAKVNVQRREGLSRNTSDQSELEEKMNQPFKRQPSNQKNKPPKHPPTANASGVLKHNNQKQNCPSSKGKVAKQSAPKQQERKVLSGDAYSGRNKMVNKITGNSRVGYMTADLDREGSDSSNKDFRQKKRLTEQGFHSDKAGFTDNILVSRHEKHIQPNVIIDEHVKRREDNRRDGTDVVSFTFTSPLKKTVHGSRFSTQVLEKTDTKSTCSFDANIEKDASLSKDKKCSSLVLSAITGDALSLLLEQKLRELTAGFELSDCSFVNDSSSAALAQESKSTSNALATAGAEHEEFLRSPCNEDLPGATVGLGVSSTNGQVFGMSHKLQEVENMEYNSSSDALKEPNRQYPSPLSVLEASSIESCNSSESSCSIIESKLCPHYAQAHNVSSNCANKIPSTEPEAELLDSALSSLTQDMDGGCASEVGTHNMNTDKGNWEYVKEVLQYAGLTSPNIGACYMTNAVEPVDPILFERLESQRSWSSHKEVNGNILRRKMLFDCINECLDIKYYRYFRAGYQAWNKGVSMVGKELAEELYQEVLEWKSMGDWMVDELVDKDMSNTLGRWVDFHIEAFETGVEIERGIIDSLVDDVIADFLVDGSCR